MPAATSTAADTADLSTSESTDTVAVAHLLVSTAFLAVGGVLAALWLGSLSFLTAMSGVLSPGRLRSAAMTALMIGWLVQALVGAAYYVVPRIVGARLRRGPVAMVGLWALSALTVLGVVLVLLGLGDGVEPFSLPWWLDLPVLVALMIPAVVVIDTIRHRTEQGVYVSLWFVMAGVVWLPMLYAVNAIPGLAAVGRALQETVFVAGFGTLWVTTMGIGAAYYVVVKATGNPLSNRQLARVGFWSLAIASIFAGPAQLAFGATPDWLDAVAAVLGLALPVAAFANAYTIGTTLDGGWDEVTNRPSLSAIVAGLGFVVAVALVTSISSFRSAAALVGFTSFWDGVGYVVLFGVGGLFVGGWAYQALPAMTGRELASTDLARRHIRWTVIGVGATGLLLVLAGLLRGFAWTGGSFSGIVASGADWSTVGGSADVLIGLAVLGGILTLAGQLAFALNVYRTITSGHVTVQEVLVERRGA